MNEIRWGKEKKSKKENKESQMPKKIISYLGKWPPTVPLFLSSSSLPQNVMSSLSPYVSLRQGYSD